MPAVAAAPNAIETYQTAVSSNPNSAEAYSNLGWGYYGLRKFDEALNLGNCKGGNPSVNSSMVSPRS